MQMKKKIFAVYVFLLAMVVSIMPMEIKAKDSMEVQFDVYASVYDFGARVDKIVIELPEAVKSDSVHKDTFTITSANKSNASLEVLNGKRNISNISVSDAKNGSKKESGKYIIIELETELHTKYAEILQWDEEHFTNVPMDVQYNVKQNKAMRNKEGNTASYSFKQHTFIQNEVDEFSEGTSASGLHYRDFKPKKDGKKHPLIIWLHGAGEGGKNNVTQINGNRGAVAFIGEQAKKVFDNPYVLAPQSPDYWMPKLVLGDLTLKGTDNTANLVSLIKDYIKENPNVDPSRVYIGGCSMGGYQTWETLFAAPELFAAAFPICAAYPVPKDKLELVKKVPIWLVHAENDDTIPVQYTRDAFANLKEIGGNVQYTEYANVQIKGEDFASHGSWIFPLNNDPKNDEGVHFFEWMAAQRKSETEKANNYILVLIGAAVLIVTGGLWMKKHKNA